MYSVFLFGLGILLRKVCLHIVPMFSVTFRDPRLLFLVRWLAPLCYYSCIGTPVVFVIFLYMSKESCFSFCFPIHEHCLFKNFVFDFIFLLISEFRLLYFCLYPLICNSSQLIYYLIVLPFFSFFSWSFLLLLLVTLFIVFLMFS